MSTRRERAKAHNAQQSNDGLGINLFNKDIKLKIEKNMNLAISFLIMAAIAVLIWIGTAIYLKLKEGY